MDLTTVYYKNIKKYIKQYLSQIFDKKINFTIIVVLVLTKLKLTPRCVEVTYSGYTCLILFISILYHLILSKSIWN